MYLNLEFNELLSYFKWHWKYIKTLSQVVKEYVWILEEKNESYGLRPASQKHSSVTATSCIVVIQSTMYSEGSDWFIVDNRNLGFAIRLRWQHYNNSRLSSFTCWLFTTLGRFFFWTSSPMFSWVGMNLDASPILTIGKYLGGSDQKLDFWRVFWSPFWSNPPRVGFH